MEKGRGSHDERQVGCPCCEQVGRMQVGASSCGKGEGMVCFLYTEEQGCKWRHVGVCMVSCKYEGEMGRVAWEIHDKSV